MTPPIDTNPAASDPASGTPTPSITNDNEAAPVLTTTRVFNRPPSSPPSEKSKASKHFLNTLLSAVAPLATQTPAHPRFPIRSELITANPSEWLTFGLVCLVVIDNTSMIAPVLILGTKVDATDNQTNLITLTLTSMGPFTAPKILIIPGKFKKASFPPAKITTIKKADLNNASFAKRPTARGTPITAFSIFPVPTSLIKHFITRTYTPVDAFTTLLTAFNDNNGPTPAGKALLLWLSAAATYNDS
jgi:hypothetical protein